MDHKPLPIGFDNFEEIIQKDYYYVDKTSFIKKIIDYKGKTNLFTRPRRFGKTLTLSILDLPRKKCPRCQIIMELRKNQGN